MHKRFVNHCTIDLTLIPQGPILIKSGREGADPTKPQMEFVETYREGKPTIYLPGSSLKGAIRAHAERIVRTLGQSHRPDDPQELWATDPLNQSEYKYLEGLSASAIYHHSSFTDQLFGSIAIASRLRIEDAYPNTDKPLRLEERNGVAIDRVFGSAVRGALFDYQVCTTGEFHTKIHLKNFTLAQLGLVGLVLRDLDDGWFGLGFAKSRGLGSVSVELNWATVQYPGCIIEAGHIHQLGQQRQREPWALDLLLGVGEFLDEAECHEYGFPDPDRQETTAIAREMDLGLGVQLGWGGDSESEVTELFALAVQAWRQKLVGVEA